MLIKKKRTPSDVMALIVMVNNKRSPDEPKNEMTHVLNVVKGFT